MHVISINVGLPRRVEWDGEVVETAIFKEPVAGAVRVHRLNLEGDRQADLTVHGGADKAVYAYPSEHYPFWREELETDLPWGAFGENLTTSGVSERDVRIGDRLRIGSAEFVVTQPRTPCFKLAMRFKRADMARRFQQSGRTGFYLAVIREGSLTAGDEIFGMTRDPANVTVADLVNLIGSGGSNQTLLRTASELEALPRGWRDYFRRRLR
jgi:MOSC domain-containing protein YiiM